MEVKAKLCPGDFFCTSYPGAFIGKAINFVQKAQSIDNQSELSHGGYLIDSDGTTAEQLWKIGHQNIWEAYGSGERKLLIGRHKLMTPEKFEYAHKRMVSLYENKKWYQWQWYPFWRLGFFLIPGAAKWLNAGFAVCTEYAARFLVEAQVRRTWKGVHPDILADYIVRDKLVEIVYTQNISTYSSDYLQGQA
jgi:hypothetical protein